MICLDRNDARAFVADRLAPARREPIVDHLTTCALCRELVGAVDLRPPETHIEDESHTVDAAGAMLHTALVPAARAEPTVERGTTVGRYTILERVGQGGFGEVFAAYDPELDRKIAIKLLRAEPRDASASAEARLLREAKAIARLSHANVVTVHDAGTFGARVFVAMEFVDGATLKDWLAAKARGPGEILEVYAQAGRGLAAAHAAGLVHRDFKPGNVMVRKDGGVLVMDFGLVRQIARDGETDLPDVAAPALADEHELDLTRTGELVGTPAYMAPEQIEGRRTDARTDQFSFCVALYAALYGERPFAGETLLALRENVLAGKVRPPPERTGVPPWLRRVLLRGLAVDPAARFPTMEGLLAALDDDPAARRRKWFAAAGVVALAATSLFVAQRTGARGRTLCAGGAARLAGIWEPSGVDSPRKRAVQEAFARVGKSYGPQAFKHTSELLDAYVTRWLSMDRESCEATRVRSEQPEDVLALRTSCLDNRLASLRALTDVFTLADKGVVLNAVEAVDALPSLEPCADVSALRNESPLADVALQRRLAPLRERFARVQALVTSGQCALAAEQGAALVQDVRAAGYRPLLAETLQTVARLGDACEDPHLAIARLKESFAVAYAAGLDRLAAEAAMDATNLVANRLGDVRTAEDWLSLATAAVERAGNDGALKGNLYNAAAQTASARGDFKASVALQREAVELTRKVYGPDNERTLIGIANLGDTLTGDGDLEEGLSTDREALASTVRVLGSADPHVANIDNNMCEALNGLHRFAEARDDCLRALKIWDEVGADAAILAYGRTGVGIALVGLGRADAAIPFVEAAVRDRVAKNVAPAMIAESRFALARALWSRPAERERAHALAKLARAAVAGNAKATARIDAWLANPS